MGLGLVVMLVVE